MKPREILKGKLTLCRTQYLYLALALIGIFLALVSFARAEVEVAPTGTPALGAPREEARGEARRTAVRDEVRERFINLAANAGGRMEAVILRFTNISDRLGSRIEKLAGEGIAVDAAREKLADVRERLEDVEQRLRDVRGDVEVALRSDTPLASFRAVRPEFFALRDELRAIHKDLKEVIALLKGALRGGDGDVSGAVRQNEATSSPRAN